MLLGYPSYLVVGSVMITAYLSDDWSEGPSQETCTPGSIPVRALGSMRGVTARLVGGGELSRMTLPEILAGDKLWVSDGLGDTAHTLKSRPS